MKLLNQNFVLRFTPFLFIPIVLGSVFTIAQAQVDALNPCISGKTEEDLMGFYGIWKGSSSYVGPRITVWGQQFEFRLRQDGVIVAGEGSTSRPSWRALANFQIRGTFDGGVIKAKSSNFNLISRYRGNHDNVVFNACQQFDFNLFFIERTKQDRNFFIEDQYERAQRYEVRYEADILKGTFDGVGIFDGVSYEGPFEGRCITSESPDNLLVRTPETIIVMFGGCRDGSTDDVRERVYTQYVNKLKTTSNYGQYAKYFAYNRIKEAKLFIYNLLKVSPNAKIALVGHSLGGDATFRLAQVLARELPEVKIDLVITLDPVTLKSGGPALRLGQPIRPENSRAIMIPSRPDNIIEWINVFIKPWSGKGNWIVENSGIQWREQPGATNITCDTEHDEAGVMFFSNYAQLGNMSPRDKLYRLEGLANRGDFKLMLLKLDSLSPMP